MFTEYSIILQPTWKTKPKPQTNQKTNRKSLANQGLQEASQGYGNYTAM